MDRSWKHIKNNNVLLVKIEGPGAGIPSIIIETCCERGKQTPLLINQPMGKGHLWSKNLSKMVIMLNIHLVECTRYLFQGHWLKKHHRPFTNHSPTSCRQLWLPATVRKRKETMDSRYSYTPTNEYTVCIYIYMVCSFWHPVINKLQ